ncbi:hypothetical protein KCP75_10825 [Salmonella enterica subsp. enterica]|nr:hypothetical protein KCP75_10825 [Salmonella enterica subsp. enterica]
MSFCAFSFLLNIGFSPVAAEAGSSVSTFRKGYLYAAIGFGHDRGAQPTSAILTAAVFFPLTSRCASAQRRP